MQESTRIADNLAKTLGHKVEFSGLSYVPPVAAKHGSNSTRQNDFTISGRVKHESYDVFPSIVSLHAFTKQFEILSKHDVRTFDSAFDSAILISGAAFFKNASQTLSLTLTQLFNTDSQIIFLDSNISIVDFAITMEEFSPFIATIFFTPPKTLSLPTVSTHFVKSFPHPAVVFIQFVNSIVH